MDLATEANAYLIESRLVEVPESYSGAHPTYAGVKWSEPDESHLRTLLRQVYSDYQTATRRGARGRQALAGQLGLTASSRTIGRLIRALHA
jgi:hypothetical protein